MLVRRFRIFTLLATATMVGVGIFVMAHPALAQGAVANLTEVADATGLGQEDIRIVIGRIVRIVLGFLGIIATLLVMYGGYLWMTAHGDTERVDEARKVLTNAGIGLIIILSSLAITQFVLNALQSALGLGGSSSSGDAVEMIDPFSTALGAGSINWHYPRRNAQDVPRNTNLSVAFREAIDPGSLMDGYADDPAAVLPLKEGSVFIYPTDAGRAGAIDAATIQMTMTPDQTTFVFNPDAYLGSASADTGYTVELTPDITLATGASAFTGAFGDGYIWRLPFPTELDYAATNQSNHSGGGLHDGAQHPHSSQLQRSGGSHAGFGLLPGRAAYSKLRQSVGARLGGCHHRRRLDSRKPIADLGVCFQ